MEHRYVDQETGEILDFETQQQVQAENHTAVEEAAKFDAEQVPGTALVRIAPGRDEQVMRLLDEVQSMQEHAREVKVATIEDERQATNDLLLIRDLQKKIEGKKKEWLDPLKSHQKSISDTFDLLLGPVKGANEAITESIRRFKLEQKRQAEEAARIQQLEREVAEAKLQQMKASGEVPQTAMLMPEPEPEAAPAKSTRSELGTSTGVEVWKWKWKAGVSMGQIVAALPPEYLIPNETKIGQMVRAKNKNHCTEADFGGVIEIYEDISVRASVRRS